MLSLDLNQLDIVSLYSQSQQATWILDQCKVFGGVGGVGWSESKLSVSSGPKLLEFVLGLNLGPSLTISPENRHKDKAQTHIRNFINFLL